MEKRITKTTTEHTYDKEGFIIKSVVTTEEWTEPVKPVTVDGVTITSGTITGDKVNGITIGKDGATRIDTPWSASKGVPPTDRYVNNIVGNINLPKSTITEITNEVLKGLEKFQGGKPF
jgi:hypothetical protein